MHIIVTMTRNELLLLPAGKYLITDNICNYIYVLHKYPMIINSKDSEIIARIQIPNSFHDFTIFYNSQYYKNNNNEEDFCLSALVSVGGLSFHEKGFKRKKLCDLHLVGVYNSTTTALQLKNFKLHHIVNATRYDKKFFFRKTKI